jgi:hypothetical protein
LQDDSAWEYTTFEQLQDAPEAFQPQAKHLVPEPVF